MAEHLSTFGFFCERGIEMFKEFSLKLFFLFVLVNQTFAQRLVNGIEATELLNEAVNVIEWDGRDLPDIYQRSQQLPLDLGDIKLLSSKFKPLKTKPIKA